MWQWLEGPLGKPSIGAVAHRVTRVLESHGAQNIVFDPSMSGA